VHTDVRTFWEMVILGPSRSIGPSIYRKLPDYRELELKR